jgi:hypothetical protein
MCTNAYRREVVDFYLIADSYVIAQLQVPRHVYPYSPADEYVLPDFGTKCAEKRDTHTTEAARAQGHEGKLDALPESPLQEIGQPVILLVGGKINLRAV